MERLNNWDYILTSKLRETKNLPFKYGSHDCASWSAYLLRSYTTFNWKPDWTNRTEALKKQSNTNMEVLVSELLGPYSINILNTKRGDLVQKGKGMQAALGIAIGGGKAAFLVKSKGICHVNLVDCTYSWEI